MKEQGGAGKLPLPLPQLPPQTSSFHIALTALLLWDHFPVLALGRSWLYTSCFPKHSLLPQLWGVISISALPQMCLPFPRLPRRAGCSCGRFLSLCSRGRAKASIAGPKAEASLALPWPWALASDTGIGQSCATEHIIFITECLQAVVSSSVCFWGQPHWLQYSSRASHCQSSHWQCNSVLVYPARRMTNKCSLQWNTKKN